MLVAFAASGRFTNRDEQSPEGRVSACVAGDAAETCLERVYAGAVERGEVAATLAALDDLASRGQLDDCHLEAHRLARAVYRAVGEVRRTFLLGGPACRFGYLHGAVEASRATSVPRCDAFKVSLQRRACAHGYGHAVMLRSGHDIVRSVDACRASGLDEPACVAGVMMENSLRYAGRPDAAVTSARACGAVVGTASLERACLENVGVVAALATSHDPGRASARCRALPRPAVRDACLRGAADEIAEAGPR